MFVNAVARNRNAKSEDVRSGFGQGRVVSAQQAVSLGMADRVATLDETITRLFQTLPPVQGSSDPARAETDRQAQSLRERVNLILQKE
jgi:ClpP class serine protease